MEGKYEQIKLTLVPDKAEYHLAEVLHGGVSDKGWVKKKELEVSGIIINAIFENTGNQDVTICNRWQLHGCGNSNSSTTIEYIVDRDGERLTLPRMCILYKFLRQRDFVVIKPGMNITQDIGGRISEYFLQKPGIYDISIRLHSQLIGEFRYIKLWTGVVDSNKITITVT